MTVIERLLACVWWVVLTAIHSAMSSSESAFRVERWNASKTAASRLRRGKYSLAPAQTLVEYLQRVGNYGNRTRKPVLFWHIRKAGGTSFVRLARLNGEVLHPYHVNGNASTQGLDPVGALEKAIAHGVTFLAMEYKWQYDASLLDHQSFHTCVLMRNPIELYRSNAVWLGRLPRKKNPMVRFLCPENKKSRPLAAHRLKQFDTVLRLSDLGSSRWNSKLLRGLGWELAALPREKIHYEKNVALVPFEAGWNDEERIVPWVSDDLDLYKQSEYLLEL